MGKITAQSILDDAKAYRAKLKVQRKKPTWSDYESYKSMLYSHDLYGYEGQLANTLGL